MFYSTKTNNHNIDFVPEGIDFSDFQEFPQQQEIPEEDEEEYNNDSKIPFMFSANPSSLIDDGTFAQLDGNDVKVLNVISRYINLGEQILIGKRYVLTGWSIPVSHSCIADKAGLTRRTIVDKVKDLLEADVIEKRKAGKCYQYRLTAYADGIRELREEESLSKQKSVEEMIEKFEDDLEEIKVSFVCICF